MKLSKKQRSFIEANKNKFTAQEFVQKLNIDLTTVEDELARLGMQQGTDIVREFAFTSIRDVKAFYLANLDIVILLVFLLFFVYINSLWGEFVSDDLPAIVRNPIIKDFKAAFTPGHFYAVVAHFSFKFFGPISTPLHVFSLLLHILNSLLLLPIIAVLFKNRVALIAVFLFAVHPLNSEVVNWISAQLYAVSMFCLLSCALLLILYRGSNKIKYLIAAAIIYATTYLCLLNPILLVVPLMLSVFEVFLLSSKFNIKRSIVYLAPFFLIGIGYFFVTQSMVSNRLAEDWAQNSNVALTQSVPYSMFSALKLLVYPENLTLYHEGEILNGAVFTIMVIVSLLFVAAILYVWFKLKDRQLAGLLLFIPVSIAPVFSPVQVSWFVADRYLYYATIAFAILLAKFLVYTENKYKLPRLALILTSIIVVIYSVRTVIRNNEWSTPKKLWEATARESPFSPRVYNNLGDVYANEGDVEKAMLAFQRSIALDVAYAKTNGGYHQVAHDAMHNIGNTLMQYGQWDEAEKWLFESLKLKPNLYQSYYKLGLIEYQRKNFEKAAQYFEQAYKINPEYVEAINAYNHVVNEKL